MTNDELLSLAKVKRREVIRALRRCRCAYPLVRYRNGSGHAPDCPAHEALGGTVDPR